VAVRADEKPMKGEITGVDSTDQSNRNGTPTRRKLILHFHLFKNAGTSLDFALRKFFGKAWAEHDEALGRWLPEEVSDFVIAHPGIHALSSHTALLPAPDIAGVDVHSLLFVRHPIDRIRSVYDFQLRQNVENFATQTARRTDLAGFVRIFLDRQSDRSIRNFHVHRLALQVRDGDRSEVDRAVEAVQSLPFVGIVEHYDESLRLFQRGLARDFPGIRLEPTHRNITSPRGLDLSQRLDRIREALGATLYEEVVEANQEDLSLYDVAVERHAAVLARHSE
jgi:hypothetical protein